MIRQLLASLISAALLPSLQAPEYRPVRIEIAPSYVVSAVARSIAKHEGAGVPGTLPDRLRNPGALVFAHQDGAQRDRSGYARFSNLDAGWRALRRQVELRFARGLNLAAVLEIWDHAAYLDAVVEETGLRPEVMLK